MKNIIFESKFNKLYEQIMLEYKDINLNKEDIITEGKLNKILSSIGLISSLLLAGITFNKSLNKSANNTINNNNTNAQKIEQTAKTQEAEKISIFGKKALKQLKQHQQVFQKYEQELIKLNQMYQQTKNKNILQKIDNNINKIIDLLQDEKSELDMAINEMDMWIMTERSDVKAELKTIKEDGIKLQKNYEKTIKTLRDAQYQKILNEFGPK